MKFKVGDKVKFLNEKGGGVVTRVISPSLVNVMTEDGFDLPTMTGDIIKMGEGGKGSSMFDEDFRVEVPEKKQGSAPLPVENVPEGTTPLRNLSYRAKNEPGIYLAYVPHEQRWLVTGPVEVYLVNFTTYDLIFSFFLKDEEGRYAGQDYDMVPGHSKKILATVEREELGDWLKGLIQVMFHHDTPETVFLPVSTSFRIKPARMIREEEYKEVAFMEEKAVLYSLATVSQFVPAEVRKDAQPEDPAAIRKAEPVRSRSLIDHYATGPKEAVVDLHIDEITDDPKKMTGHEILNFQMAHFNKVLESAIANNYHKVTFIHGVGNGSLKSAIIKRLKDYESLENHSASLARFGVGALDVVIRPMK